MKKIILAMILFFTFSTGQAFADYTLELKNESGVILKTFTITTFQVQHLQKTALLTGKTVIDQFKETLANTVAFAKLINKDRWARDNDAYIEDQAKE